jgi:hypothetical protein
MTKKEEASCAAILVEVRRLDVVATKGPWEWEFRGQDGKTVSLMSQHHMCGTPVHPLNLLNTSADEWDHNGKKNRDLIAYYRTAAPALATEVERLQTRVEELEEALRRVSDEASDNRIAAIADDALNPKVLVDSAKGGG